MKYYFVHVFVVSLFASWIGRKYLLIYHNNVTHISSVVSNDVLEVQGNIDTMAIYAAVL